ncbi:DUF397 domain-containing protein [Actinoplanes sp. N902-109]|uniref:DUF397 domain-containing protein n=1 Tax=Actinoplanes sp. (strain N902-109) TaxID=649831 RepID=UPI0003293EAD|nr:DUF397 domain-containing protein [Actinoplanes sp. N902-109]AGL13999.1 putative regulatory protein [Actinoplanes sp. N902-109]
MSAIEKPVWHSSSRCTNSQCIEVAKIGDDYLIRDSKDPAVEPLRFPATAWHAFLTGIRAGEFG